VFEELGMRRRDLMAILVGAAAYPLLAGAQQKTMPVVGYISSLSPAVPRPVSNVLAAFHEGLRETGYVEGQNLAIEYRWADGNYDRLPALAADLVGRKVDLIVTGGGTPTALAAKNATSTIPIVFTNVADPVGVGLVASLARTGGNLTGFSDMAIELMPKRLELLSELVPQAPKFRNNFNWLRSNSLRIRTRNFLRPCRELNQAIREVSALIRESSSHHLVRVLRPDCSVASPAHGVRKA